MALTKEQIFTAADNIRTQGQTPTLARVRAAVGGGSFTTISEAMNEWRSKQRAKDAPPLREPIPEAITRRLIEVSSDVWAVALDLANARLAAEREVLDETRGEIELSKKEAAELADQMSVELEVSHTRIADLETQLLKTQQDAEKRNNETRTQLNQVQLENAALKARLEDREQEIEERKVGLNRMESRLDQLQRDLLEIARIRSKAEIMTNPTSAGKKPTITVKPSKKIKKDTAPIGVVTT